MEIISRVEAKIKGLTRYYTGSPCKRGHYVERKISNGTCVECARLSSRAKRSTKDQREKDKLYRSTKEYKSRKCYNKRVSNHIKIIDARLKCLRDKERAGAKYISKDEAVEHSLSRYFDGSLCKRDHMSERSTGNGQCMECYNLKASEQRSIDAKAIYYLNNKERLVARNVERQRERYAESPEYKASVACRNMLKRVLRECKTTKRGGSYEMLGYTRDQLMSHISNLFTGDMSWDNYGKWHIDHIKPVSKWLDEGVQCPSIINAISNLQPLWAVDNLSKSNKFVK